MHQNRTETNQTMQKIQGTHILYQYTMLQELIVAKLWHLVSGNKQCLKQGEFYAHF